MSANGGNSSGIDIVSLGLSVDATQPEEAAKALDKLGTATIIATKALDGLTSAVEKNDEWTRRAKSNFENQIQQLERAWREEQEAKKATEQLQKAKEALITKGQELVINLQEQIKTFGMSREQLMQYRAAQLGVAEAAEPLIQQLEKMRREAEQAVVQQKRDIEQHKDKVKALQEEEKQTQQAVKNAEKLSKAKQDAFNREAKDRAKHISEYSKWWEDQLKIQDESVARQKQNETVFQAFKRRTLMENRREAIRILEAQEREAIKSAERRAIEEIAWARMSVKQRIAELEKLKAYQADSRITPEMIASTFSGAAIRNLPNLGGLKEEYKEAAKEAARLQSATEGAAHAASLLRSSIISVMAVFGGRELVHMIDGYTKFNAQLKLATANSVEYADAYEDVKHIAKSAQSELAATGTFYARIQKSTEELNISQQKVADITEVVALSLRAGGATAMETASTMHQLSQAFAAGRLNGQEFNSVAEAAPRLMKALADGMGVPVGALKELATEGKLTSEIMAIALPKALEELRKEADSIVLISAAWTNFHNALMEYIGIGAESTGTTKALSDALKLAADNINLVVTGVVSLTALGLAKWLGLATLSFGSMTAAAGGASVAIRGFFASLGPIGWAITAIGLGTTAWQAFGDSAKEGTNKAKKEMDLTTPEILADLDRQIKKIEERNQLAREGLGLLAQSDGPEVQKMLKLRKQMNDAMSGTGDFAGIDENSRMAVWADLGKQYGELHAKVEKLNQAQKESKEIAKGKKIDTWMKQYATDAEKLNAELKKAKEDLGVEKLPAELEKRIRDRFEKKTGGRSSGGTVDKELNAYQQVITQIKSKIDENELELKAEEKISEAYKVRIRFEEQLASGKLKLTAAHRKHVEALLDDLEKTEILKRMQEEQAKDEKEKTDFYAEQQKTIVKALDSRVEAAERDQKKTEELRETLVLTKAEIEALELARLKEQLAQKESTRQTDAEASALMELIRLKEKQAEDQKVIDDFKEGEKALKKVDDYLDPAKAESFGEALRGAFDGAADSLVGLINELESYNKQQESFVKAKEELDKAREGKNIDEPEYYKKLGEMQEKNAMQQIASYGKIAGAAKGMFSEQSAGYKTLEGIQKIAHAVQVAMMLKEMAMLATKAVMNQGQGDPYSAWARMAAMAAAMATLGFAVGGGFQGKADSSKTAASVQERQNKGTVLGDSEARSESITKAIEKLADNSDETMPVSLAMLRSLRNIEAAMGGVASAIARATGITGGNTLGFQGSHKNTGLFGIWGSKQSALIDSGLFLRDGASTADLIGGQNIGQYGTVENIKTSWFGLKSKYSYDRIEGDPNAEVTRQISKVFQNMVSTFGQVGEALGYKQKEIEDWVKGITWTGGDLSLRGLKGDELSDALNNWFSAIADEASRLTFAGFDEFQRVGEGHFDTIVRVANGVEKATVALENLGIQSIWYQDIIDKQGEVDAEIIRQSVVLKEQFSGVGKIMQVLDGNADELIDSYKALLEIQRMMTNANLGQVSQGVVTGSGGFENLAGSLEAFYEAFFSDEEKLANAQKNLFEDFAKIGVNTVPKTREEYRKLVEVLSKDTSDAGQKFLGRVLNLAEAFDKTASMAEDFANEVENAWTSIADSVINEIERIRGKILESSGANSLEQIQAQFAITNAQARAGDLNAAEKLTSLSQTLLNLAESRARTREELDVIRATTANTLEATLYRISSNNNVDISQFTDQNTSKENPFAVGNNSEQNSPTPIFSSQQNNAIIKEDLALELKALRQELSLMREENNAQQISIVKNVEKMQKIFTRNETPNGILITDTRPA